MVFGLKMAAQSAMTEEIKTK